MGSIHKFYLKTAPKEIGGLSGSHWFKCDLEEALREVAKVCDVLERNSLAVPDEAFREFLESTSEATAAAAPVDSCQEFRRFLEKEYPIGAKLIDWARAHGFHNERDTNFGCSREVGICIRMASPGIREFSVKEANGYEVWATWTAPQRCSAKGVVRWLIESGAEYAQVFHGEDHESMIFDLIPTSGFECLDSDRESRRG